jgi:hypothetical protein
MRTHQRSLPAIPLLLFVEFSVQNSVPHTLLVQHLPLSARDDVLERSRAREREMELLTRANISGIHLVNNQRRNVSSCSNMHSAIMPGPKWRTPSFHTTLTLLHSGSNGVTMHLLIHKHAQLYNTRILVTSWLVLLDNRSDDNEDV